MRVATYRHLKRFSNVLFASSIRRHHFRIYHEYHKRVFGQFIPGTFDIWRFCRRRTFCNRYFWLLKVWFDNKPKDIFDFPDRSGLVEKRSEDKRPPAINSKSKIGPILFSVSIILSAGVICPRSLKTVHEFVRWFWYNRTTTTGVSFRVFFVGANILTGRFTT